MASYHTRSRSLRPPTHTDGLTNQLVGMNESARGPASMPTEQAGPEFAPSPKGRSTPGGEPGSERSVGPLSAGALDPEAPGPRRLDRPRNTDPRNPHTQLRNSHTGPQRGSLTDAVFRGRSSSAHQPSSRRSLSPPVLSPAPHSQQSQSAVDSIGRVQPVCC